MNQKISLFLYSISICLILTNLKGYVNYLSMVLILLALVFNCFGSNFMIDKNKSIRCFIAFILFYFLTSLINFDLGYWAKYSGYYIMSFSGIVFSQSLIRTNNKKEIKKWIAIALFFWFAIAFKSITVYINDPGAARKLAASREDFLTTILGGYQFAFGCALLFSYLLPWFYSAKNKTRCILFFAEIVLFITIYLTESSLTTFATILGFIAFVFFRPRPQKETKIAYVFLILFMLIAVFYAVYYVVQANLFSISSFLSANSDLVLNRRLTEIINRVYYDDSSAHYDLRLDTLVDSFHAFLQSPLIGQGYKYGYVFTYGELYGVGNHSCFFDSLAQYGLLGAIPLFGIYYNVMKDYYKNNVPLVVTLLVLLIFNPFLSFQSNLPLFFFFPLLEHLKKSMIEDSKTIDEDAETQLEPMNVQG